MSVAYPLEIPVGILSARLKPRCVVAVSQSPFTYTQQVQVGQGEIWTAEATLESGGRPRLAAATAFLTALRGSYGTFLLGDPLQSTPLRNASPGSPVVSVAGQSGRLLQSSGWTTTDSIYALRRGDMFQLGSGATARLYMVLVDAHISGGDASLEIWPALRSVPDPGDPLTLVNPRGVFRLTPGQDYGWTESPTAISEITLQCMEAL